jgi:hypothetical protein
MLGVVLHDENRSGGTLNRPGLLKAIARMERGESDGIVVRSIDRFMRSVPMPYKAIKLIEGDGRSRPKGRIFSVKENFDLTTDEGRLHFNFLQTLAQYYRDRAASEWSVSRARAFERGVWLAPVPVGYLKMTAEWKTAPLDDGHVRTAHGLLIPAEVVCDVPIGGIFPDPVAAPVVREAFLLRGEGESHSNLARFLTARLGGGRRCEQWSPRVVRGVLSNRAYLGDATFKDVGTNRHAHAPIIDEREFRAAQLVRPVARSSAAGAEDQA